MVREMQVQQKNVKEKTVTEVKKVDGFGLNDSYVEMLRSLWLKNPTSVALEWQEYFAKDTTSIQPIKIVEQKPIDLPIKDNLVPLIGIQKKIAQNMTESILVPTATSSRQIPVKILEENRALINEFLESKNYVKCSFTHIIAYFIVKASIKYSCINNSYSEDYGPTRIEKKDINLGIAIDLQGKDGLRNLVVPSIKSAQNLNFKEFFNEYNNLVSLAHAQKLEPKHFMGTSMTLTNPGTLGTVSSSPRLMKGQGAIIATGAIGYPAQYEASNLELLQDLGVGKIMTVSCTYDHRIIQGAESGKFLAYLHELLNGEHEAYEEIFNSFGISYRPYNLTSEQSLLKNKINISKEAQVIQLINAYRTRGHLLANLDPLSSSKKEFVELDLHYYGLSIWDLDKKFNNISLRDTLKLLRNSYCNRIAAEYMFIDDLAKREWLCLNLEKSPKIFSLEDKKQILKDLIKAEGFEQFLHKRYVGYKRFSLEGAETLIAMLRELLDNAAINSFKEVLIGMAHRGRLNVLANILQKPYEAIFAEFEDLFADTQRSGDVKYHLGAKGIHNFKDLALNMELAFNPSHLEAINPVLEGMVRAKQDLLNDDEKAQVFAVLIHGDAAFAGQGVVYETLQMSNLAGYSTGGSVHIIINNQIGYTADPAKARSSQNCTDIAKFLSAPIFRVNADDPESCINALRLAFEYKIKFKSDVVIDLIAYRRYGHNEGDEPSFTQPVLYQTIKEHPSVTTVYADNLLRQSLINPDEVATIKTYYHDIFDSSYNALKEKGIDGLRKDYIIQGADNFALIEKPSTIVSKELLLEITTQSTKIKDDFNINHKVEEIIIDKRKNMVFNNNPKIDFGAAEILAYGSLLKEGVSVRISGQDCGRGTFAHRHAVLYDIKTSQAYIPLKNLETNNATFEIYDSLLSEEAVLGFEYGYSVTHPKSLVIWEAQFGDFFNGAQIQIDQFIASSEQKWNQKSRLVMMLPHGYDGQGPEHSSGRIERFLQLSAQNNWLVCNCSTSAQLFHLLRKQALGAKKPLIIFSHKSLLRTEEASCHVQDLTQGSFKAVISDETKKVSRIIFVSGKIYWELKKYEQSLAKDMGILLVRIEQLYPFAGIELLEIIKQYPNAQKFWLQEEPRNNGAFLYMKDQFNKHFNVDLGYIGRKESASPAVGSPKVHKSQQQSIIKAAFEEQKLTNIEF
jgi:2-oxoglutarate decarboxylase